MTNASLSYAWLGLLGLTVSFTTACSDDASTSEPTPKELTAPLTVPVPTLNQFVVLSRVSANFGQRCIVTGGDIGVAAGSGGPPNTLTGGNDSRLGVGEVLLAPRVVLGARAVTGEIGANQISAPPDAMTGPRSAFVAPPAAPTPGAVNPGGANINVGSGQTSTRAAGRFNNVTVSGTLNLSGGLYELRSLRLNPDARVVALADSTVRILETLSVADRGQVNVAAGLGPQNLRLMVAGNDGGDNSVTLGADARLSGLVVAQRTVRGADRAILAGSIAARQVILGNDARLSFNGGFECSTNAGCDDGNACTADTCVDTKCTHSPAPNGTACSDGNQCTTLDACQAGACSGGAPVVCAAQDPCHDPGSCDPLSGVCSNPARPDGAACSDADSCTQTDVCQAGSCQGTNPVMCAALDQCHVAGSCDPASGVCSDPAAPDGQVCDDGDPCSLGDACSAGDCAAGTDFSVSEFSSGLSLPSSIVAGPLSSLWFVSPETTPGASNGSIARITTAGVVTRQMVSRNLGALLHGPDDKLWVSERLLGGLTALGRFDTTTRAFASDFTGINAFDLAASNDAGTPIVWFTGGSSVGRITPTGTLLGAVPTFFVTRAITAAEPAPTTIIWFTEANGGGFALVGRLDFPRLQQFAVTTPGELVDIVEGPDGGIWFTDPAQNEVGRMPAAGGTAVKYSLPSAGSAPHSIAAGPDGNVWLTLKTANKLARMTPSGDVMEICIPTEESEPTQLAFGSDGNLWFTEAASGKIGRVQLTP